MYRDTDIRTPQSIGTITLNDQLTQASAPIRIKSTKRPAITETTMIQYWKHSKDTSITAGNTSNET